jgi:hypothetical protein
VTLITPSMTVDRRKVERTLWILVEIVTMRVKTTTQVKRVAGMMMVTEVERAVASRETKMGADRLCVSIFCS